MSVKMQSEIEIFFTSFIKMFVEKKILIDLRYLLLAVRIFNLPPFPDLRRRLVQFIHAEVTRVFFTLPSGRGLVQTRIPSVISIRVVISLGVGFSLKMKMICWIFFIENILEQNKKKTTKWDTGSKYWTKWELVFRKMNKIAGFIVFSHSIYFMITVIYMYSFCSFELCIAFTRRPLIRRMHDMSFKFSIIPRQWYLSFWQVEVLSLILKIPFKKKLPGKFLKFP